MKKKKSDELHKIKTGSQDSANMGKQAEELHRESEGKYRSILENIREAYFEVDLDGNYTFFNDSLCRITGFSKEELAGAHYSKLSDKESSTKAVFQVFNTVYKTGKPAEGFDWPFIRKDGSKGYIETSVLLEKDSAGNPIGFKGIVRDITERKQIEEKLRNEEQRFRTLAEQSSDIIVMVNRKGIITYENPAIEKALEFKTEERMGSSGFDLIHPDDLESIKYEFNKLFKDINAPVLRSEIRLRHKDGSWRMFEIIASGLSRENIVESVIVNLRDITSRKQAEVALLESREHLQKENIRLRSSIRERYRFCDIIGKSQVMQNVYEFILQAAATQANVIIYGESGTGKELVAKAIHETSDRSQKSFVTVHCGAIPETLMESEFFGYKKGAFTGANMDKRGYLEEAGGGTLFLDEMGEIGLNMQVKLLRAIAGDGYAPVGSSTTKKTDVRIIAATNRNLRDLVKQGIMREDFFYRINILPIYLPPLRERKEDLPLLIDHFLQLYDENHTPLPGHILESLLQYDWLGNVRELQNVLHRYLTLKRLDFAGIPTIRTTRLEGGQPKDGVSVRTHFAASTFPDDQAQSAQDHDNIQIEECKMTLETIERDRIIRALSEHNWHRGRTASALGINRKTLFLKMQKFGLAHY